MQHDDSLHCTIPQPSKTSKDITRHDHDIFLWVGCADGDVVPRICAHLGIHMAQYLCNIVPVEIDEVIQVHLGKESTTSQDRNTHITRAGVTYTMQKVLEL
jgi:hypothetical protein